MLASEGDRNVRVSPPDRTTDPAAQTLCAGAQDTLARALVKEDLWQPGTNLRAWLFTIMHHQNVNTVRRGLRESAAVDIESVSSGLPATTDPTASRHIL